MVPTNVSGSFSRRIAQAYGAVHGRPVGKLRGDINLRIGVLDTPAADGVEVLEGETQGVHQPVAAPRTPGSRGAAPSAPAS